MTTHVQTQQQSLVPYVQAMGAGAITGMRSMAAPAIIHTFFEQFAAPQEVNGKLRYLLASSHSLRVVHALSIGEMISDKLPLMPARTDTLPLLGRGVLGALAGAAIFSAYRKPPVVGAVVSGSAALCSTYGSYYLRRTISEKTPLPDVVAGLVEDGVMIGLRKALFSFSS